MKNDYNPNLIFSKERKLSVRKLLMMSEISIYIGPYKFETRNFQGTTSNCCVSLYIHTHILDSQL